MHGYFFIDDDRLYLEEFYNSMIMSTEIGGYFDTFGSIFIDICDIDTTNYHVKVVFRKV